MQLYQVRRLRGVCIAQICKEHAGIAMVQVHRYPGRCCSFMHEKRNYKASKS